MNFELTFFFVAICKSFLREIWGHHKRAIRESFLCEKRISRQFVKVFSLKSFPLCGVRQCSSDCMKLHLGISILLANVAKCKMVIIRCSEANCYSVSNLVQNKYSILSKLTLRKLTKILCMQLAWKFPSFILHYWPFIALTSSLCGVAIFGEQIGQLPVDQGGTLRRKPLP